MKGTLKVVYTGELNTELDNAIIRAVEENGYVCWASGHDTDGDVEKRERDICFDKVEVGVPA